MEKKGKYLTAKERKLLEKNLQTELSSTYQRRIKIMLLADEGLTKAEITRRLKCTFETARYWINQAEAGQIHKWQDCFRGRPKTVDTECLKFLEELVQTSPHDYGYPFKRWTGNCLSHHLKKELDVEVSSRHVNRLLKRMGISARIRDYAYSTQGVQSLEGD